MDKSHSIIMNHNQGILYLRHIIIFNQVETFLDMFLINIPTKRCIYSSQRPNITFLDKVPRIEVISMQKKPSNVFLPQGFDFLYAEKGIFIPMTLGWNINP